MDHPPARDAVLTAYSKFLIKFKARQLSRKSGFSRSDEDDFSQELTLHLLSQAHNFDPGRASANTFAAQVIQSKFKMILRDRCRQKRAAGYSTKSLEQSGVSEDGEITSLRDTVTPTDLHHRTGDGQPDGPNSKEALVNAFQSLPVDLQAIASRLTESAPATVAREMGISRRQLAKIIERIRRHFEKTGLGDF